MKSVVYLILSLAPMALGAQALSGRTTSTPGTGGTVPTTTPPPNASAGAPALAVNSAAISNNFSGIGLTNQFGTNFISGDLSTVLLGLQGHLQQALVLLSGFNGNFSIGSGTTATSGAGAASLGQNLGVSAGQNLAANFGQNVAPSTAPSAGAATPPSVFAQPSQSTVPATALAAPPANPVANITGVPVTAASANALGSLPINNSVRLLIILQNDIERLLPQVAAATGTPFVLPVGAGAFGTNSLGVINNTLGAGVNSANTGTPRIPARTTTPRALSPTGR